MADDPRREPLMHRLAADFADEAHWSTYGALADQYLSVLNAADPLRAPLLADEDRSVEFVTEVRWNAKEARMQDEFGRTPVPWTNVANYPGKAWRPCCENWRAETRKVFGPVLAALREVANGG